MTAALAPTTGLPGRMLGDRLLLAPGLSFDDLLDARDLAEQIVESSPWWLADIVAEMQAVDAERYVQTLPTREEDPKGIRHSRLKQAEWMAEKWPPNTRVPGLSYTHHRVASSLEPLERASALREAVAEGLTTRELIDRVKDRQAAIRTEVLSGHSEPACAADRPWTPSKDDLLPEWRTKLEAAALDADSDDPRAFVAGYLKALVDTGSELCFREDRWRD